MRIPIQVLSIALGLIAVFQTGWATAQTGPATQGRYSEGGVRVNKIERPLRYTPVGTDFVIANGTEFFNRPLYGGGSAFRVDTGDRPEFALYLPGRGGNLRFALRVGSTSLWVHEARQVVARYRPGMMLFEIRDPILGDGLLQMAAIAPAGEEGLLIRTEYSGPAQLELLVAFGGVDGWRGRRDGDIGCEVEPVSKLFQLRPENCRSNTIALVQDQFAVRGNPGVVGGVLSGGAELAIADATDWNDSFTLFNRANASGAAPLVTGRVKLQANEPVFLGLQRLASDAAADEVLAVYREVAAGAPWSGEGKPSLPWRTQDLAALFAKAEAHRRTVADRLAVETPDPYLNAAVAALNVAEEGVWDERVKGYVHGAVAWRVRLLGWRVGYAGNLMGAHDRSAMHFEGFARQQNTNDIPAEIPLPEVEANLARNETALHSNGDMTRSHYDMNMVGVDVFFRHLLWTGDLAYARRMWPVIERHLAWERRLFRREFGPEKLPLYEAYACIWASDDLAYNGGGATHSSAYNLYHNRMAARVAKLLGKNPGLYEQEAALISRGMRKNLWLADRGWFAEWKDLLGLQLVHPNAAAWTFYHTVDSEVPTSLEAWQMTRFVDTQLPRFPIGGPGVPPGSYTIATTSWMPYTWSLNNVVLGESMHTALAYWQANRADEAFPLFKGAILDSMYLGLCPGNVGMCTWFDAFRRESQRDFGDGVGAMARAVVEGLFGLKPDLLAGEVTVRPGFPKEWNQSRIRHADLQFSFNREGLNESYRVTSRANRPLRLRLMAPALRDRVGEVTVNGKSQPWRVRRDEVGQPRIEISAPAAMEHLVKITWEGGIPEGGLDAGQKVLGEAIALRTTGAAMLGVEDPQRAFKGLKIDSNQLSGTITGTLGHRTAFVRVKQGDLQWCLPVMVEVVNRVTPPLPLDWAVPINARFEPVNLASRFNDSVSRIFENEYRSPRSPHCSLAMPKQGIGSWCHPKDGFEVDDSGLRQAAAKAGGQIVLPNGVKFATPAVRGEKNVAFVSQWENYPREISVPLQGKSPHAYLLMAGSTDAMKSRFDNGEVVVTYRDGSTSRLALHNPTTWWPIDQDYYIDEFAFARPEPLPPRVDLATGTIRILKMEEFKGRGRTVPGGAATVLDLPLDQTKELESLTVRAIANEVVIGLMSVTLQR